MKLREFNFKSIQNEYPIVGLCVMEERSICEDSKNSYEGFICDVLRALPIEWADREIKETRWFFNTFVIELCKENK